MVLEQVNTHMEKKKKQKTEASLFLTVYTKISSKWFIDPNPAKGPLASVVSLEAVGWDLEAYWVGFC